MISSDTTEATDTIDATEATDTTDTTEATDTTDLCTCIIHAYPQYHNLTH